MYGELIFEVVIFVGAVFFYIVSMGMQIINPIPVMRPNWWPQIILVIMMIVDGFLIYGSVHNIRKGKKSAYRKQKSGSIWLWLIGEVIAVAVFIILQTILGFLVSAIIFCLISSFIIDGGFKMGHIWISLLIASVITVFFGTFLGLPLPRGMAGTLRDFSYLLY